MDFGERGKASCTSYFTTKINGCTKIRTTGRVKNKNAIYFIKFKERNTNRKTTTKR